MAEPPRVLIVVLRKASVRDELRVGVVLALPFVAHDLYGYALVVCRGDEAPLDVDASALDDARQAPRSEVVDVLPPCFRKFSWVRGTLVGIP